MKIKHNSRVYIIPDDDIQINLNKDLDNKWLNEEIKFKEKNSKPNQFYHNNIVSKNSNANNLFDIRSKSPLNSSLSSKQHNIREGKGAYNFYNAYK